MNSCNKRRWAGIYAHARKKKFCLALNDSKGMFLISSQNLLIVLALEIFEKK